MWPGIEGKHDSMTKHLIRGITFDLWDTIILDDSDEPKRAEKGLPPKPVERRNLVEEFLGRHGPVSRDLVNVAYDTADAAFRQVWYGQNVTWTVRERLSVVLKGLGRELPEEEFKELVRLHEDMELRVRPDLVPGAREAVKALYGKYKLAVISDAIFSPGRALRQILKDEGLAEYFDAFVFSDEAGCSKPEPRVFEEASRALGIPLSEIAHVGDREQKDIAGPHKVGARGILFTQAKDRGSRNTRADAVCTHFDQLLEVIESLDSNSEEK